MARRAPVGEDDGAAGPVGGEEAGGRHVVGEDDGSRRDRTGAGSRQRVEDPVAHILEIGRPGAEILVLGGLVARDLPVEGAAPGVIRRHAGRNLREGIGRQRVVLQHGDLETPGSRRPRRRPLRREGSAPRSRPDRRAQGRRLGCRVAG